MKHVHAMDIRPDVIIKTGVIQPYAIRQIPPGAVARQTIRAFESVARPPGPRVRAEMQPEEFAARAKRVAVAMAAGKRVPKGSDPKLVQAARMIMEGKPFVIKSAGRVARVAASPAQRVVRDHRAAPATVTRDNRGRTVVRDHRGKSVSVRDHRQGGGYWNIYQR